MGQRSKWMVVGGWIAGAGSVLLAAGHYLGALDTAISFACKQAPGVVRILPWVSCERVVATRETPLYREQVEKFLIAARDGDEPFLRQLARHSFRLRSGDVCRLSVVLAEVQDVPASAIEIISQSSDPGTRCSTRLRDIAVDEARFVISTGSKPLDETLLELLFTKSACPGSKALWLQTPASLAAMIRGVQTRMGVSSEFRDRLDGYQQFVGRIQSAPKEAFMGTCSAQSADDQGANFTTLLAFEPCKHSSPPWEGKQTKKGLSSEPKVKADCEARFDEWKAKSIMKRPYSSQGAVLAEVAK
jgi:hypothetical protein